MSGYLAVVLPQFIDLLRHDQRWHPLTERTHVHTEKPKGKRARRRARGGKR